MIDGKNIPRDKDGLVKLLQPDIPLHKVAKNWTRSAEEIAASQDIPEHEKPFFKTFVGKTLLGQNRLGKALSALKNLFLPLAPFGRALVKLTNKLTQIIKPNTMSNYNVKYKKSRLWGIVAGVVGIILTAFGIGANVQFLANGLQTADIPAIIGVIQLAVAHFLHKQADEEHQQKLEQK